MTVEVGDWFVHKDDHLFTGEVFRVEEGQFRVRWTSGLRSVRQWVSIYPLEDLGDLKRYFRHLVGEDFL